MNDIIDQLQSQIQSIKTSLNTGGASAALQTELINNQILLQGWINKLVVGGSLTQDDINSMQQALDDSKKRVLDAQAERTKRTTVLIGIGVVAVIGGIIFYYYKKNKK